MRKKGVSSLANRWLNQVYKVLAITLVLFAVLISALRIMLPYVQEYRQEFQDHINSSFDSDIAFGTLNIDWKQNGPLLIAENVRLLQTDAASVFIKKVDFHLDFWKTVKEQRIQTKALKLAGAKIYINQSRIASLSSSSNSSEDFSLINNISEIFLEQVTQFSLINSEVLLHYNDNNHVFKIDELRWLNQGERHRANGSVILKGLTENTLNLQLDVVGHALPDMRGQLYVEAKKLDITPWLGTTFSIDNKDTDADINFQAWMDISEGLPKSTLISLDESDVAYRYNNTQHRLRVLNGEIQINYIEGIEQFVVQSNAVNLFTDNYEWQPFSFSFIKKEGDEFAHISSIDLEGAEDLLPLFLPQSDSLSMVEALSTKGQLKDLYLRQFAGSWEVVSDFSGISTLNSNDLPGIENMSGQFVFSDNNFHIELLAESGHLDFGEHFRAPLPYDLLTAKLAVAYADEGLFLNVSDLELTSPELSLSADVGVIIPSKGEASMALLATVQNVDAKNAPHYYPHILMGDDLVEYLEQGIISGEVEQAVVLFNGPLDNFPFEDNSGIFSVNAEMINSQFMFDSDWPAIQSFNANLNFTNNSMLITAREGRLQGIKVKGVETAIADLDNEQILTVDAHLTDVVAGNITRLMNNSPMHDSVGATLKELVVSGLLSSRFHLNLPLNDLDSVVAKGNIKFANNLINLQTPSMNFTEVNGELTYVNEVVKAEHITMKWEGLPLALKVKGSSEEELYRTALNINALWKQNDWELHMPSELNKYLEGDLSFQGDLSLDLYHNGDLTYDIKIASLLTELALSLPEPYQKNKSEKKYLQAYGFGNADSTTLDVTLDNNLNFYGVLDHNSVSFTKSHLVLGKDNILLPLEGFYITTQLEDIEFSQWQPFISDVLDSISSEEQDPGLSALLQEGEKAESELVPDTNMSLLPAPEEIRGDIGSLKVLGQEFTNISFNLQDETSWWQLTFNAKEARSEIKFYPDWLNEGVEVNADFLHLSWPSDDTAGNNEHVSVEKPNEMSGIERDLVMQQERFKRHDTEIDRNELFDQMPKLVMECASCKLEETDLGQVSFEIERKGEDKLVVKDFKAKRGNSHVNFDIEWQHNDIESHTQVSGDLKIEDLEVELKKYGFPSTMRDSNTMIKYDISWNDAPSHFAMESFNGGFFVELDDGYLAEVDDKARIFSVLSLQSLVRKLSFDFRDIFSDGMFYSEIKGDFDIKNGILYTENTRMKGAAGDLNVKGNTDLNQNLVDYRLSYKPNLTSSLPVLAWVATLNPVTFLAGVALNEVITSQVVSEINFELTGNINDPVLVEVDRKSKDVKVEAGSEPEIVDSEPTLKDPTNNHQHHSTDPKSNEPQVNKFNG